MRKILHLFSLLLLMLCSTGVYAKERTVTVDLSKWTVAKSDGSSVAVDANGVMSIDLGGTKANAVTITSDQSYTGITKVEATIQTNDRGKEAIAINVAGTEFTSSYDATSKYLTIGTISITSNNTDATGSVTLATAKDGNVSIKVSQPESTSKTAKIKNVKITYTEEDKEISSEAISGVKVNGSLISTEKYTKADNVFTLTDSYALTAPTVKLVNTITYVDKTSEDEEIAIENFKYAEGYFVGTATVGQNEITVKVPAKALSTTLADVTGSTTWDWTKTGETAVQLTADTYPSKLDEFVLSNVITKKDEFNSEALKVQTEYAVRDGKYFQGGKIMFHTTKPGTIKVSFSNTGDRKGDETLTRYLHVNGTKTEWGANNATVVTTEEIEVPAGDVILTSKMSSSEDDQYLRIYSIAFTEKQADPDPTPAEWESYELVLNKEGLLTAEDMTKDATGAYPEVSFGIALDEEGNAIRVAADAADAIAVITGKYHSDHGMSPFSMKAKVPGAVKITAGTCSFGTCTVTVNGQAVGEPVEGDKATTCWKNNKDNVATGIYNGEAGEITITTGCYTPYIKIEKYVAPEPDPQPTEWESYELVLNKEGLLTTEDMTKDETGAYPQVSFGIALDEEGNAIRVAADAADAIAVVTGKYHSDHGMSPFSMTAKVPGAVKITAGTCSFGTCTVTVNGQAVGEPVVGDNVNKTTCWKTNPANVATGIYNGDAGEITITTGTYTPYIKIEKLTSQPKEFNVTYNCDDEDLQGKVPAAFTVTEGNKFTVPANRTMYREGWTLSEWTVFTSMESEEAVARLKPGDEYTPTSDCYLYPIWNENNYTLADREEAVTVKWDFQKKNGAPIIASEGKDGEIYVTQVNLNVLDGMLTFPVDVKLDFSTKSGKVNNASWDDWCQMNSGTKFTIPSCKGATVSIESYDATTTTTVDGVAAEGNTNKTYSTEIGSKADAIDIVIGDGKYFRYIQVVLPVVETPAPVKKEKVIYSTEFSDWAAAAVADSYTTDVTTTDKQDITFTLHQTKVDPTSFDESRFKEPSTKGYLIAEKKMQGTITTTAFNNITTLTFVHGATGGSRGWGLKVKGDGDNDWVTVSDAFADPSQGQKVEVEINRSNVQLQFYNLADAQNAYLMSLEIKGMVEVTGESYTVGIAATPAEGGAVTIYPKADDYTEGDEITLTATENFGYNFVNWTNAAGEEVSKDAKFKTTVSANETYTANFVQVDTYAINVAVEGGANDYMVTFNPAPTVVENKNMYEAGTKVALTAAENPILTFNNWSNGETSKEIEVTMNEDIDLTATYSAVDFIVGWDFYKAGNNGRNADFFAADNDAVSLVLRDEAGKTYGWLDKSQLAAGGYEGRPGAVNWKNDAAIGTYYWQTKVNAEAFTDLKVKTAMVYNYNAYQKYDVQASLNGTDWETIGSIKMSGAKAWTDLEASFPATYNNQKEVYVRWIADKESAIDGTTSQNDGACLGATYITGTAKLVDDGTAPVLVSTVPAEGADNASANGKIVLTFDEKVKVAEGAKATLGDAQLTPAVSGKTVSFEYKGLQYSTAYTFTLPANSVSDLTDNAIAEAITINFQTKAKPTIEKGLYDVIVTNGEEMKAAIAQANSRTDKTKRFRIFVMPGSHKIPVYDTKVTVEVELANGTKEPRTYDEPRTYITSDNISIIGADYETTTITNTTPIETFTGRFGEANVSEGIGNNDVFQIQAKNTYFQGVTVKTGIGDARGRDIAVQDKGDKTIFKDARLWGYQDTYTNNNSNGRFYFEGGVVRGRTDYLCGKGDIWFEGVTLQQCGQGGYPIVPSQPKKYGWIFNGCTLTPETSDVTCTLGRPWGSGTPIALLINTTMEVVPGAEGWSEMSGGWPKRFAEYNSTTKTGTVIDLSQRKKTFGGKENINNPILTAEEAAEYSIAKVMGDGDDWDPTAYTEQASAPTNVSLKEEALTWDDSNYVFCWAVIKNGNIVEFTTTPTYTVDDKTATWSVRAANEMGGLGEATIADTTSGINEAVSAQSRSAKYVTPTGIVIVKDGKKYTVTGAQMK